MSKVQKKRGGAEEDKAVIEKAERQERERVRQ